MRGTSTAAGSTAAGSTGAPEPRRRVVVLDTGLAPAPHVGDLVNVVARPQERWGPSRPGHTDNRDVPDDDGDEWLDPVAGHGTFIAGIITRLAPHAAVEIGKVLHATGEGNDADLAYRIAALLPDPPAVLCLACSCYTDHDEVPPALAAAVAALQVAGTVVVAAAGNECTSRPSWPSALPDVVSVAALDAGGPAPFTNYGGWVRACAPGTDIVSTFYSGVDDPDDGDPKTSEFEGWARWSGTSFAAPIVAAMIVREMDLYGLSGRAAVRRVIDDPRLLRLPGLGTVVNAH